MSIYKYNEIKKQIPPHVTLVAVSKTRSVEEINTLYSIGQKDFGENKVQEILKKQPLLQQDINWHFIGHLQTNKVKQILPFIHLIHSVDSEKLLLKIDEEAKKINKKIKCLLQPKIAQDETKYGMSFETIALILQKYKNSEYPNIEIIGLMGMASFTDDQDTITAEFSKLKNYFEQIKMDIPSIEYLSMGMSGDYQLAINCGSNMLRIGSILFTN